MSPDVLWSVDELVAVTQGKLVGTPKSGAGGVSIDTRTLAPGDLFVAIRGDRLDGHDYAAQALKNGACAVLVESGVVDDDVRPRIEVDDTLAALEKLGIAARARTTARVIAVTGSVGKTGTKEALRLALAKDGRVHASAASYNNHWGVPLSLSRLPADADYAVFEVGMNSPGEIEPLSRMIRPHIAIITTVEPVHIEFFDSVEQIADAKAEVFAGLESGGTAILNRDNAHFERLADAAHRAGIDRIVSFGEREDAESRLLTCALHSWCSCVTARVDGHEIVYKIGAPGRHLVMNSLAVLSAVSEAGADLALGAMALADMKAPKGRGARQNLAIDGGHFTVIDESYNANPASMRAALATLQTAKTGSGGRKIAVLGDMLELGDDSDRLHETLARAVESAGVDLVFACGPHMSKLWKRLPRHMHALYAETSEGLAEGLEEQVQAGDVVMVKGSLGSRMGPLVEALSSRFRPMADDESEVRGGR